MLPVVKGIAPKLSICAEIVWGHARDDAWPKLLVQEKQFRVRPYITGVARHKKRQVTDYSQALVIGVTLQPVSLAEYQELCKGHLAHLIGKLTASFSNRCGLAMNEFARPLQVIGVAEPCL